MSHSIHSCNMDIFYNFHPELFITQICYPIPWRQILSKPCLFVHSRGPWSMIQRNNVWCIDYELLALQRSHLIIITEQPLVKLSLLPVLLEVLPPAAGLGRWPVRRHPAALGAPVLVAGHLAHLYQDAVETGRRATAATSVVSKQKYFIHHLVTSVAPVVYSSIHVSIHE